MAINSFGASSTSDIFTDVISFNSVLLSIFPLSICLGLAAWRFVASVTDLNNYIKPFRFESDGQSANSIETGRIRKTTGIIMDISAFPAAVII